MMTSKDKCKVGGGGAFRLMKRRPGEFPLMERSGVILD